MLLPPPDTQHKATFTCIFHHRSAMPVKPLSFKGDKLRTTKKRKQRDPDAEAPNPKSQHDTTADDDDLWVDPDSPSDLAGPMILVLPTKPPTCLASDAHGNIFASPIENMIEGNPVTAEPHDVRQVWVVGRVAGMGEGEISLKGSHGGFLSCDGMGILGAKREARGVEEGFVVERAAGEWRVKTAMGEKKYLCAVSEGKEEAKRLTVVLRGDGDKESETTSLILRMQARFKPKLQRDKEQKKSEKVSRAELERVVGRRLDEDEVRRLKRAKRDGTYHEEILDVRVRGKHDKFA